MTETQAQRLIELTEQSVYFQGVMAHTLVIALGAVVAIGVCILLYRAVKVFY